MPSDAVFVVDGDGTAREGLKLLLCKAGFSVAVFESAQSFLDSYDPAQRGCLLVDFQMPSMTGLELQQELNLRGWRIPVIFVTGHATIPLAVNAIKAGAFDLLEEPVREDVLLDCLRRALGESDADRDERSLRAELEKHAACLTLREREVLTLIAAGEQSKMIARQLGISFRTVEGHRAHILRKLHARSPADLIRLAFMFKSIHPT